MDKKYIEKAGKYICIVKKPPEGWIYQKKILNGKMGAKFVQIPCVVDMPENDQHGRESIWYGYLTEKSRERTIKKLKKVFDWDGCLENEDELNSFEGKRVRIQCDKFKLGIKTWLSPFMTKKKINRAILDENRRLVIEQLQKEYPHMKFGIPGSKKVSEQ